MPAKMEDVVIYTREEWAAIDDERLKKDRMLCCVMVFHGPDVANHTKYMCIPKKGERSHKELSRIRDLVVKWYYEKAPLVLPN